MRTVAAITLLVVCILLAGCPSHRSPDRTVGEGKLSAKMIQSVTIGGTIYELPHNTFWNDTYNLRIGSSYRLIEISYGDGSVKYWAIQPLDAEAKPRE